MYDIKAIDDETHQKYTGTSNRLIFENLVRLLKTKADVWIRIPIIPGVNDTEEEIENLKAFFETNGYPKKIEFLPYHAMGEHKYAALGRTPEQFDMPSKDKIEQLKKVVTSY